jgi:CHC2 zinc finger
MKAVPRDLAGWLHAIHQDIWIYQLLDHYEMLEGLVEVQEGVHRGPCPLHHGRKSNDFYVYEDLNSWCCYGDCHRGGTPLDFVSIKEGVSFPVAGLLLQSWFGPAKKPD